MLKIKHSALIIGFKTLLKLQMLYIKKVGRQLKQERSHYMILLTKESIQKKKKLTAEGTKCVAMPTATSSLPFNLVPVRAKNSPADVIILLKYIRD